ncbi:peptidylprolyl isomerase [Metaclostridioides mangenotii]|uniref:peptidylprolyl isomerase n=1 Tax=Metaclostridioides mangenotii TaxID=1540 RepID=UPI00046470EE|nr:peptidylprolyl isomerase [Clostridioides mangenotii]
MKASKFKHKKSRDLLRIKQISIITLIGLIFLGIYMSGKFTIKKILYSQKTYSKDKIVATMSGFIITEEDLKIKMDQILCLTDKSPTSSEEVKRYEYNLIDHITKTEILYKEGKSSGIKISGDEINKQYTTIIGELKEKYSLNEDRILNKLSIDKVAFENEIDKELIARRFITTACKVSDEEAKDYYFSNRDDFLEIRASHILIKDLDAKGNELKGKQKDKAKDKADQILKKALTGSNFADLAKEYSEDPSSKYGGDLGYFGRGEMVESFEKAAFSLNVNQIYDKVVKSDYGYHIIKRTSKRYKDFSEVKNEIINKISYEKQSNLIRQLKDKYNLNVVDEYNYKN